MADGRIASIDPADDAPATQTVNVAGKVIAPGLLDLHTHVYPAAISVGVDPDEVAAGSATTTVVDAGSAGAGNTLRLRQFVTDAAHMSGCSPS